MSWYRTELGMQIRALRTEQGLSLRRLALMIGIDHTHLLDIELGRIGTTVDTLAKIAQGLGVDIRDLFAFEKNAADE